MKHKLLLTTSFLLCLTCLVSNLFAVTYTSINGGDWNDPIAWQGGIIPPTTILTTDIVIIDGHNIYMNVDVTNNGKIQLNDGTATYFNINVGKTLTNSTTGTIVAETGNQGIAIYVEGSLINAGTITLNNLGTYFGADVGSTVTNMSTGSILEYNGASYFVGDFNNSGQFSLDNQSSTSIEAGATFTNTSSGSVSLASEAVFTVKGTLINNNVIEAFDFANITTTETPVITNNSTGTITLNDNCYMELIAFTGTAMMTNSGTINIASSTSQFANNASAQFTNTASGVVLNTGIFYNYGSFINAGTFTNTSIYSGNGTFSGTLFTNPSGGFVGNNLDDDCMTFSNGFTNNGTMDILLSNPGTTPVACTDFDHITVTGTATLGGDLFPTLISGLEPEVGDVYVILTATAIVGTFSNNTIDLNNGTYANVTYTATEVIVTITGAGGGPSAFNVTGGGTLCGAGAELEVGLDGSEVGVDYQLQLDGVDVGTAVSGDGFAITFGNQTGDGTYTVNATRISDAATATMTGSVDMLVGTIPAAPTITLSGASTVCLGASVTLTGVGTGGTATEFAWFRNGTFVKYDTQANYTFSALAGANTYTLVAIYSGSCPSNQSVSTIITTVAPPALITPTTMPPYCVNTAPVLNANTGTGYSYSWVGTSPSAATATGAAFTPTHSGNHKVIVTDGNGCSKSSAWMGIALNALPSVNAGIDKTVCMGSTTGLGTSATVAYSYSWSPSISLSSATSATPTFTASATGNTNYTITVTNTTTGCKNTDVVGITAVAIPATPSLTSTSSPICQGATITLIPSGTSGAINWYKAGLLSNAASTAAPLTLNVSTASAVSYTIRAKSGTCLSAESNPISAWIQPAPTPTLSAAPAILNNTISVCNPGQTSGTAQLIVNLPSGSPTATYNWQQFVSGLATNVSPAATTSTYTASVSTAINNKIFRAQVTYSNGCLKNTSNVTVKMLPSTCTGRTGHPDDLAEESFTAYPNPTENSLNVSIQNSTSAEGKLVLYNTLGQAITSRTISLMEGRYEDSFDLSELALGIYTLSFQTKDGNQVQKIVKE